MVGIQPQSSTPKIAVLCGGAGAAKILSSIKTVVPESEITAIVNTGDDFINCGLYICPDLDTITYTLASKINKSTGWGLEKETWKAMESLKMLDEDELKFGWFNLGDKDIGTHLYRTARLAEGAELDQVTKEITSKYGIEITLLPMTNDPVSTRVKVKNGDEISFQEYFVKFKHQIELENVIFEGAETACPLPDVLKALESAEKILIAPSNPILSIGPILSIQEIAKLVRHRRKDAAFISPIIGGKALKGPADRVLLEMGHIPDAVGVANFYSDFTDFAVIDIQDQDLASSVEKLGIKCLSVNTIMSSSRKSKKLAEDIMDFLY